MHFGSAPFSGPGSFSPSGLAPRCCLLDHIRIWFRILTLKFLKRRRFISLEDLKAKMLVFTDHYGQTMVGAFK
jgi:hypothetical protein